MIRRAAGAATAAALVALALALGGCGNDAQSLAQQACTHVNRSLALYAKAKRDPDAPGAAADRRQATVELEAALPLAASANSANPKWNPLMTTLQESTTNSEANLVTALRLQCATADSRRASSTQGTAQVPG